MKVLVQDLKGEEGGAGKEDCHCYGNPEHHARKVVAKQPIKGNIVFRAMVGLRTLLLKNIYLYIHT